MKKHALLKIISFGLFAYLTGPLQPSFAATEKEVADYLGFSKKQLWFECSQETYEITDEDSLKVCLHKKDQKKRCEITIRALEKAPAKNDISFSFRLSGDYEEDPYDFSILQIHSTPDKGESWRCPPYSAGVFGGSLSVFNRWDPTPLSVTTGYNCTEAGSTIKGRSILENKKIEPYTWHPLSLTTILTHEEQGYSSIRFGQVLV